MLLGCWPLGGARVASARESCSLLIPATEYLLGGLSAGMLRAIKLIAGRVRLIREMRGLHTKLPPRSVLMSIVGVASMGRLSVLS